jgi:hypothetical protein
MWTKAGPVVSGMPADAVEELRERSEASLGDPTALGLLGFAVGTLLIGIPLSGVMSLNNIPASLPAVLVFAGISQWVAGIAAFRKGNTFAGTAMGAYGANNVLVATYFLFRSVGVFPKNFANTELLGVELICFGYISLILAVAAIAVNFEFFGILATLVPGFTLVGISNVGAPAVVGDIGGWFLIVSAGLAFYGASAVVINSAFKRRLLPLLSRA